MNLNYTHLGKYLLAGIASGLICIFVLAIDHEVWIIVWPSLVLGVTLFLAGRFISEVNLRSKRLSPLILIGTTGLGWYLAFEHALSGGFYFRDYEAGGIGGLFVGIGLAFAWKLNYAWRVIVITTLSGIVGALGVALEDIIPYSLFVVWQGIVLLAIGIAIQIDATKSSVKES